MKPKQLSVVPFPVKTSAASQEPLEFQVEVVSDDVHLKLNSSVELKVGSGNIANLILLTIYTSNANCSTKDTKWCHQKVCCLTISTENEQVLDLDVPKNITNPIEKSERAHVKLYGNWTAL